MNCQLGSCAGIGCDCLGGTETNVVTDVDSDSSSDLDSKASYGTIPHVSEMLSSHIYLRRDTTLDQPPVEPAVTSHQLVHVSDTSSSDWTSDAVHPQNDDQATSEEPPICSPQHLQSELSLSNSRCLPLASSQHSEQSAAWFVASTSSCKSTKQTVKANPKAQRARFLLFIKILFKYLVRVDEHLLHDRAKCIVLECTQRNRMGDPRYTPLVEAVERQLKPCVGEVYWRQAALLLRHFETRQFQV